MENFGTGVRNVLIASIMGTIVGFLVSFCMVASLELLVEYFWWGSSNSPIGASAFIGLLCGAPPGVLGGFIGGFLGGLSCLKPDMPIRHVVIRGALGGFIFGLCGGGLGFLLRGSMG
jgi:hypothetical protein